MPQGSSRWPDDADHPDLGKDTPTAAAVANDGRKRDTQDPSQAQTADEVLRLKGPSPPQRPRSTLRHAGGCIPLGDNCWIGCVVS